MSIGIWWGGSASDIVGCLEVKGFLVFRCLGRWRKFSNDSRWKAGIFHRNLDIFPSGFCSSVNLLLYAILGV